MVYLTIKSVVAIDLDKTNDRSLAKVCGTRFTHDVPIDL